MSYNSDIPGETVEQLLKKVMSGEVVTENADKIVPIIEDNTLSTLDTTSKKPVSGEAVKEFVDNTISKVADSQIDVLTNCELANGYFVSILSGYISSSQSLACLSTRQPTKGMNRLKTILAVSASSYELGVVFYNEEKRVVGSIDSRQILQSLASGVSYVEVDIPIPNDAYYFNVSYLSESKKAELAAPDFYCYLTRENNSGDIDVSYMPIKSGYITATTGDITSTSNWENICYKEPISTFGKKYLYISGMVLLNAIDRGIAFYDENKQYVSGIKWSDTYLNTSQRESLMMLIPIPQNARYFNATFWGCSPVQAYNLLQPKITCILTDKGNQQLPVVSGDFSSWIDIADYTGETGEALKGLRYADWIAKWDALQSQYPAQISAKSIFGYATLEGDSSATAVQDTSLPIYEYIINPLPFNEDNIGYLEYPTPLQPNKVKILINTGIHGKEKTASMAVYLFVQRLLEDEKYLSLLSNCEIHICPCSNPWGYDNLIDGEGHRNNARNVNINRNFGYNWEHQAGGNVTEKGSAPYSECETQALRDWMARHSDMSIYMDVHHNALSSSPKQGIYAYTYSLFLNSLYCSFLREASARAKIKYPNIFTDAQLIGYTGHTITSGSVTEAYFVHNIEYVMTPENNANVGGSFSSTAIELAEAQVANMLRVIINNAPKTMKW